MADRAKTLRAIEELFKTNPGKAFSRTEIRDTLRKNYEAVTCWITYLLDNRKIYPVKKAGQVEKYRWKVE